MYIERTLSARILEANAQNPVILLTGPRQVRKTMLLRKLAKDDTTTERTFVTLDDLNVRSLRRILPSFSSGSPDRS